jgi:archaellum biogenesis ATPase FlaH
MLEPQILCKWPINFLQKNLYGICTGDLIVVGCGSGGGKSVISRLITMEASKNNCPVVLYSLENQEGTVATELARDAYLRETKDYSVNLRLFAIQSTQDKEGFEKYRRIAYQNASRKTPDGKKLTVIHEKVATQDWNIERIKQSILQEIKDGYRLFIIDHLDVLAPNDEYSETRTAMNELWALVANYNIALVTFSQLNKSCTALCPSQTDLRGGMNKVFKATHVITLGRHEYGYYGPPLAYPNAKATYMRIVKSRDTPLAAAICYFNGNYYLENDIPVLCDEPGMYIDGHSRKDFQEWLSVKLHPEKQKKRKPNE